MNDDRFCNILVNFRFLNLDNGKGALKLKKEYEKQADKMKESEQVGKDTLENSNMSHDGVNRLLEVPGDKTLKDIFLPHLNLFKRFGYKPDINRFTFFDARANKDVPHSTKVEEIPSFKKEVPEGKPNASIIIEFKNISRELIVRYVHFDQRGDIDFSVDTETESIKGRISKNHFVDKVLKTLDEYKQKYKELKDMRNFDYYLYMINDKNEVQSFWKNPASEKNKTLAYEPDGLQYLLSNSPLKQGEILDDEDEDDDEERERQEELEKERKRNSNISEMIKKTEKKAEELLEEDIKSGKIIPGLRAGFYRNEMLGKIKKEAKNSLEKDMETRKFFSESTAKFYRQLKLNAIDYPGTLSKSKSQESEKNVSKQASMELEALRQLNSEDRKKLDQKMNDKMNDLLVEISEEKKRIELKNSEEKKVLISKVPPKKFIEFGKTKKNRLSALKQIDELEKRQKKELEEFEKTSQKKMTELKSQIEEEMKIESEKLRQKAIERRGIYKKNLVSMREALDILKKSNKGFRLKDELRSYGDKKD